MLSPAQIAARDGRLTASRVACLMSGDAQKIYDLWRELTGDPSFEPEDLSGVWAVALGTVTEALQLDWYERKTGRSLSKRGDVIVHPTINWAAATLDAFDDELSAPVEAKHVGGHEKIETVLARYTPQAHWQMIVTGASKCVFTVIEGAREPVIEVVERDEAYAAELLKRATAFMEHVFDLTPPVVLPPIEPPVKAVKIYDFTGQNQWTSEAVTWATNRQAAKDFAAAEKILKGLIPADAAKVFGAGLEAKRDRAGRISLRPMT